MTEVLKIEHLDLVFGNQPNLAFSRLDQHLGRDEIKKETGQVVAVHNASFNVRLGEILVLMGLSGSGKSSLLRCLNGMNGRGQEIEDERDSGKARGKITFQNSAQGTSTDVLNCSFEELRQFRRKHMSMVFQQFGLMPWLTVRENVAFPLQIMKVTKNEIQRAVQDSVELVGLTSWLDRYPSELSGGMKQRVGLARAFVAKTDILLMDEPFSALDPHHRGRLQDEILKLQRELKKTIIFVSHDPNEAIKIADRLVVMESGSILQWDTPENCLAHPVSPAVKRIICP